MAGRLTVLADDRLDALRPLIEARMRATADLVGESAFDEFFDRTMKDVLVDGIDRAGAHEGTVWLLDQARRFLVPRFNSGPNAATFVGNFRQSLNAGMISMVVATEQPICENEVQENQRQDKTLDQKLGLATCAMLAVPFYFAGELRGVISGVQLKEAAAAAPEPRGFTMENLETFQRTATVLTRLIEHHLMLMAVGGVCE
jgi:hypothetical protein